MKILLAIDSSECSGAAVRTVVTRIRSSGAHVRLVHAIEPDAFLEQDVVTRTAQAERLLSGPARMLLSAGFDSVETQIVEAEACAGILGVVTQWQPDLIVLGSHGRKGFEKLMLGSVAESVAQQASCSVLIVRTPRVSNPLFEKSVYGDVATSEA
jgi:nucleotide-binding universal stress UspA family protein